MGFNLLAFHGGQPFLFHGCTPNLAKGTPLSSQIGQVYMLFEGCLV